MFFLAFVAALVWYLFFFRITDTSVILSSEEVSQEANQFISELFSNNALKVSVVKCSGAGCDAGEQAEAPSYAWRLYSLQAHYRVRKDTAILEQMKKTLQGFNELLMQGKGTQTNLYHFYLAYEATGDKEYLKNFVEPMITEVLNIESSPEEKLLRRQVMISSQRVRQFEHPPFLVPRAI